MRSVLRVEVVGFKRFKGTVDGKNIDSGKLFCLTNLNGTRNSADSWAEGTCTEEISLPDGQFCKVLEVDGRIARGERVQVELDMERVSNGKAVREVVQEARIVKPAPAVKAA
ncbi:MAG: hypothetical protein J0L58_10345 [Burkholderiales bacterium]|nr:hypothetical protein [Burkholderiales bacterium]